jgi:hypothetical protein
MTDTAPPLPLPRDLRRLAVLADLAPETVRAAYADPRHVRPVTLARVEVAARALDLPPPPVRGQP